MAAEKCTRQLPPIRVTESLEMALHRLAARDERTFSEYIKLVLSRHAFGHGFSVDAIADAGNDERA